MPRNRAKLTHQFCLSVKPSAVTREYLDGTSGLALRVTPAGSKTWTMRYRLRGTERRLTIGSFLDVPLADARDRYAEASRLVRHKRDPRDQPAAPPDAPPPAPAPAPSNPPRQDLAPPPPAPVPSIPPHQVLAPPAPVRQIGAGTLLLAEVGELYLDACELGNHRPRRPKKKRAKTQKTIRGERSAFYRYIEPRLGFYRPDDLERETIQAFVDRIEREDTDSGARLAKKTLHSIYSYALWRGHAITNPCVLVTYPPSGERDTVLSDDELRMVWRTFSPPLVYDAPVSAGVGCSILLDMVLLQRIGEVQQMRLSQLNFDSSLWEIPEELTKNRRHHVVPLPPLAMKLIGVALDLRGPIESDAVFPGGRDPQVTVLPTAATRAFNRVRRALHWPGIGPHDLRRTGATRLAAPPLSVPPFIISKLLNHVSDTGRAAAVTSIYNRYEYLAEKREALCKWQDELVRILRL